MTYPIILLRSGQFHFTGHETKSKFRSGGTVVADCDRDLALWLVTCGYGRLWEGNDLPSNPERIEYLDPTLERSRRNKISRAREEFIIQCAIAEAESTQQ